MKKTLGMLILGALLACSGTGAALAIQPPQGTVVMPNPLPNEQVFDIDQTLPSEINVPQGGTITFVRHDPFVGSKVDTSQVNLDQGDEPVLHRIYYIREPDAPQGYRVVVQYTVDRKGTGGLNVTHTLVVPGAVPQTVMIKVIAN